jgi:CRISPR-associated endonuclease Cas3-HD
MVAKVAADRMARDGMDRGMVAGAIERRWHLGPEDLRRAVHHAAALHDLGKLQEGWQRWGHDRQQRLGAPCADGEPLAHTDHGTVDPELPRPPHASASAVIGVRIAEDIIGEMHPGLWQPVLAAIIGHHGGWIDEREVQPVNAAAIGEVVKLTGRGTARPLPPVASAKRELDWLDISEEDWPLASILTRVVRLSDQKATAEWNTECQK